MANPSPIRDLVVLTSALGEPARCSSRDRDWQIISAMPSIVGKTTTLPFGPDGVKSAVGRGFNRWMQPTRDWP